MKNSSQEKGVLIVGGYGHVGRLLAAELAPYFPDQVVVAGRNSDRAWALADEIGHGTCGIELDVTDPEAVNKALKSIALVVCCIDQEEPHLLRLAVEHGLAYIDISAELDLWMTAHDLNDEAKRTGARVLIGAGLVPGLAGVMAREAVARTGPGTSVDVGILLSIGDNFGPAALDWMLGTAGREFTITEHGQPRQVQGLKEKRKMRFPEPIGTCTVHRFAIPDQIFYPDTLGVQRAGSWVVLQPGWIGKMFPLLVQSVPGRLFYWSWFRQRMMRLFGWLQRRYAGHDTYSLVVEAEGPGGAAGVSVVSQNESSGTAISAAMMARALIADGEILPGVSLPEQIFGPKEFFTELDKRGISVQHVDLMT